MRTFEEIEEKYKQITVKGVDKNKEVSGFLNLAGSRTIARLSSENHVHFRSDDDGWFDVELLGESGERILLHHALSMGWSHNRSEDETFSNTVFPNTVVIGRTNISRSNTLTEISFTLKDMGYFFWYETVEWQSLYKNADAIAEGLDALRKRNAKMYDSPRRAAQFDHSDPQALYVIHKPGKRAFRFRIEDKLYSVWMGGSNSSGWKSIDYSTYPVAVIKFDAAVPIEAALNAVWQWRRFFSQVALRELFPTSISGRHRNNKTRKDAEFYLPNNREGKTHSYAFGEFHPGDIPLNFWNERKKLRDLIRAWLVKDSSRERFRLSLDFAISHGEGRSALDDVVSLCGAIDSLADLETRSSTKTLKKRDIKLIADAAVAAADKAEINVEESRVRGVLGSRLIQIQ